MRTVSRSAVPALTTEQRRAVDRAMVEDLHIELVQMMENAGRGLAELAITRFSPSSVTVLSGPGGNGGGGLVAARQLANRGCGCRSCSPNRAASPQCPPTRPTSWPGWTSPSPAGLPPPI